MNSVPDAVSELSRDECWSLLTSHVFGRIALRAADEIDIFPINYHADGETILFRTAPGTKLLELTVHNKVAFEIDDYTNDNAWSVVVKGIAHRLESGDEIEAAESAPLHPWIPTLKYRFVRITPTDITGRSFRPAAEPERY